MYKPLIYLISIFMLVSCVSKQEVDLIIFNAQVYTVNDNQPTVESFAVKNGKFVAVGSYKDINRKFKSGKSTDMQGRTIVPGLIDGHCHFYGLGQSMQIADLKGTKSYEEILERLKDFNKGRNLSFISGRGWDQNDWEEKVFPNKEKLDRLFPNTPVALERIDGHAILANQKMLDLAEINDQIEVEGGEIIKENGRLTGVLVDGAMELLNNAWPETPLEDKIKALKDADKHCLNLGLTTVSDAGLNRSEIDLIDSLQRTGDIKIKVYAMISVSNENLDHYLKKGIYHTDKLNVRSFKVYADGALGSRGAVLKTSYSDRENHFGGMLSPLDTLSNIAKKLALSDFQMNTHAIGDSANAFILKTYAKALKSQTNRRWRIEHAQVIDTNDFEYFTEIIPSVQPTHATSDMYWAGDRLGQNRIKGAYAYKKLLDINGRIILGTDFPVEYVNPMLTFYAAVARKDTKGYPEKGFEINNGLSREQTLKGMTIWAAYGNFEENQKGSIEVGKDADFVVLSQNIMEIEIEQVPNTEVYGTYVNGEKVNF